MLWAPKPLEWVPWQRGQGKKNHRKLGECFVCGQNRDREGLWLVQPLYKISLSFPFYLTLPCCHLAEEQNRLVACPCCDPRKQNALKQSTEHLVWSTFWNTETVMLELTAPIETHRPSEAWPSLVYSVFVAVGYSAGWYRMNISKLGCYEPAKRMVIYMHIANMWRLALLCKRGIIMGAFSSL